jgi:hypothetical protein
VMCVVTRCGLASWVCACGGVTHVLCGVRRHPQLCVPCE